MNSPGAIGVLSPPAPPNLSRWGKIFWKFGTFLLAYKGIFSLFKKNPTPRHNPPRLSAVPVLMGRYQIYVSNECRMVTDSRHSYVDFIF